MEPQRVQVPAAVPQVPVHLVAGVHHGQVQRGEEGGQQGEGQGVLPGEKQGGCNISFFQLKNIKTGFII